MHMLSRREFTAVAAGIGFRNFASAQAPGSRFIKGICSGIFPRGMPYAECCRQAKNAGFDAIEIPMAGELSMESTPDQLKRLGDAARKAGVAVASFWVSPLGSAPLNSPDPEVRSRGLAAIRKAIEFAGYLDCGALLLVPGRVGSGARFQVGYETTWQRITAELKKVIPDAERAKVMLTLENVSNRFLVSPLEMRDFVDQFHSPWLQTHFDIGNVMYFGYPQDWILTLGPRIKRVHAKDRKVSPRAEQARPSRLLEGDVNWKEVMAALVKVGYKGFICPEIGHDPNDPNQLREVSAALDKIFAMA
jgi:L-ribulose-5-phosphate 3-epimerase